jgi:hypothetical protein
MTGIEPSIVFSIITAIGTTCTILVIIWNSGKTIGEIKTHIVSLQKDIVRQNGTGSDLLGKVERNMKEKVERDDCIRIHADLAKSISELYSQRQLSEERILAAIRKRKQNP